MNLYCIHKNRQCYMIKEWFVFYFNYFSLIIFYHSVWLGFELFGLRVQVCSQLVQFMLARKGYDNHHCHKKTLNRKWGRSVDDVIPRRDGLRIWKILKKITSVEFWPWCWKVEFRPQCGEVGIQPWFWEVGVWPGRLDHAGRELVCLWGIENWVSDVCSGS